MAKLSGGGKKGGGKGARAKYKREKRSQAAEMQQQKMQQEQEAAKTLQVSEFISANDLASLLGVSVNDVIGTCMGLGLFVSINQRLDAETITVIADEYGYEVDFSSAEDELEIEEEEDKEEDLKEWISAYPYQEKEKRVGVVMAGNIPAAGFHDMLCVLLSGHKLVAKLSSQDKVLIKYIASLLVAEYPALDFKIEFADQLKEVDAIIATGSDNSSRYFDYYFASYPNIIRKNRTSCAVLNGTETEEDYLKIGEDIFRYYGMGCRNLSKLYLPKDFPLNDLLKNLEKYSPVINHAKYHNNYGYHKAIFLMNSVPHLDTGFLLLQESEQFVSPLSVLYYEHYNDQADLKERLHQWKEKTQVITSKEGWLDQSIPFGEAQKPKVKDYADKVDTMHFLNSL